MAKALRPNSGDQRLPVHFDFSWRRFRVAIAATAAEREAAQALRYEVFRHEWQGLAEPEGLDVDPFDERADHLLLYDRESGLLVGTYRFIRGMQPEDFYSSTEFHLDPFIAEPGEKVELGRACLRRDWRSNLSVVGLYQGICAYMRESKVRWLFGCSSIDSIDPAAVSQLCAWFRREDLQIADSRIAPLPGHELPGLDPDAALVDARRVEDLLPPLLRTYLRAGARVSQLPVLDPEFRCSDFMTVLDLHQSNAAFIQRYGT